MRTHRIFPALQAWSSRAALLRELVSAERLAAVRIEPVSRGREPAALLDLYFTDGERSVTIPLVLLDLPQLALREADPLVFPGALTGTIDDAAIAGVVERLCPDLELRAAAGGFWKEEALVLRAGSAFDRARERGFFGAAPLAAVLPRVAPAVYARRFAHGKNIVVYGPGAHELAAFVSGIAASCTITGDDADAEAALWYGSAPGPGSGPVPTNFHLALGSGPSHYEAAVAVRTDEPIAGGTLVPVVLPLPADLMLSFDPADGDFARSFSVAVNGALPARRARTLTPAATGGSGGRIGLVVRPDAELVPDADTDEAAALAEALRAEGFDAAVLAGADALDTFEPDLVHLFGVGHGAYARRVADWAAEHHKPLAVHAFFEDPAAGGYWGALVSPYCFAYSSDDRSVTTYLGLLAKRAVEVDGVTATMRFAPGTAGLSDAERVLLSADVVFVNSEREFAVLEPMRRGRSTYVVPPLPIGTASETPVGALVGSDPFVLIHAPFGPAGNQLMLVRAAAALEVPMVLAGAVEDPAYAERVREFAPDSVRLVPEPTPEQTTMLYRTASVVADAAWLARGHGRMLTAAAHGAALVTSSNRWVDVPGAGNWGVDPADVESIARGIGSAWDAAVRRDAAIEAAAEVARERLSSAALAIVAAYAKIAQVSKVAPPAADILL